MLIFWTFDAKCAYLWEKSQCHTLGRRPKESGLFDVPDGAGILIFESGIVMSEAENVSCGEKIRHCPSSTFHIFIYRSRITYVAGLECLFHILLAFYFF